jgi:ubiquinone/menaquinone biosynthesis C-methylase UbiE
MAAAYATQGNPDRFARMPDLMDRGVRDALRQRVAFAIADWAELPLGNGSVDAIFATNALPRESAAEQASVIKEWARVVKPGGVVFIAQHNFFDSEIEATLSSTGWVEANLLGGARPAQSDTTGFQIRYSSG